MPRPRIEIQPLPIYDSLKQCSAATGIPVRFLSAWKADGCPGFKSNRIYLEDCLRWAYSRDESDSATDWGTELKKWQAQREKLKLSKDERSVIDRQEVASGIRACMGLMFAELDRHFKCELPPVLKGLDELKIRSLCDSTIERLKVTLKEKFTELEKGEIK